MKYPILTSDNDIVVQRAHGPLHMLGPSGAERELSFVQNLEFKNTLPVLLGAGLGHALNYILNKYSGPIAIVDKEHEILELTKVIQNLKSKVKERVYLINSNDANETLRLLTIWQKKHNLLPFLSIPHPFYLRLDREWYGFIRQNVEASQSFDFWSKARKPRFAKKNPRVLLITSKYFLMGEVARACERLNIEHELLTVPDDSMASDEFIKNLLTAVIKFQPDCLLTLNHLGVDREFVLMELVEQLQLPLASWFVDNPHLILHVYNKLKSPWVTIFTWDYDNINSLKDKGFEHVFYLPLGTDQEHFKPNTQGKAEWKKPISFVGNSMHYKVKTRLEKDPLPEDILKHFSEVSTAFDQSSEPSVAYFVEKNFPTVYEKYMALATTEKRLGFETAITWEATRLYRASCVEKILSFAPLIAGDDGWNHIFSKRKKDFTLHRELNYYSELQAFYPMSDINFNCTSKQMKGAVNQRIFDVPACNAFVLTDWREQMDALFEPESEIISYKDTGEIADLVNFYLKNPTKRNQIAKAARKRVLAEHTWSHRLQTLLKDMQDVYGNNQPILVLQMQRMGDLILSFPLLGLLQNRYPDNPIWTVAEADFFTTLMDFAPRTTFFPPHAAPQLQKVEFHSIINLSHRQSSTALAGKLRANNYYGPRAKDNFYSIDGAWALYRASIVQNNRYNLFHWSDLQVLNFQNNTMRAYNYARYNNNKHKVGIFVGASEKEKRPNPQFFAILAGELLRKGYHPIFLGGPQDVEIGNEAAKLARLKNSSLCGKLSLNALAVLMQELRLFITPDTGPMHLASWLKTPTLNISVGPVNPWETGPFFPDHYVVQPNMACSGCWQACTKIPCQQKLKPKQIALVAKSIMENPDQLLKLELQDICIYRTGRDERSLYNLISINHHKPSTKQLLARFWQNWFWQKLSQHDTASNESLANLRQHYPHLVENLSQSIISLGNELQKHLKAVFNKQKQTLEPMFWQKLPSPIRPFTGYTHLFLQNENYSNEAWDLVLQDIYNLSKTIT